MDALFAVDVAQNSALSAEVLWQAVRECIDRSGRGPTLPALYLVLPLAMHRQTALAISTKQSPSAIQKALSESAEIPAGLQSRVEAMFGQTSVALNVGFAAGLLRLNPDTTEVVTSRATQPVRHDSDSIRLAFHAAKRIGQAFTEKALPQLLGELGVRF